MPIEHKGKSPQQFIADAKKAINALPKRVGKLAASHFRANMDNESFDGKPWPERNPRAPRNKGRKLLRDKGTMYRSIDDKVTGANVKVFFSEPAKKYAELHNEGGYLKITVTAKMRKWAWAQYYRAGGGQQKSASKTMGERSTWNPNVSKSINFWKHLALTKKTELTIKMPKRQVIGDSPILNDKIFKMIEKTIYDLDKP